MILPHAVFICSPYRGDVELNTGIALELCRRAIAVNKIPFAPHLYFTRFIDDADPDQRALGIELGLQWLSVCWELWQFGEAPTEGMLIEIAQAHRLGIPVRIVTF